MIKIPPSLRGRRLGGSDWGSQVRKEGFLHQSPAFLMSIGDRLGLAGKVHKVPGARGESGIVELDTPTATVRLHEDKNARDGVILEVLPNDGHESRSINVHDVGRDIDLDDWVYSVKKMLAEPAKSSEGNEP